MKKSLVLYDERLHHAIEVLSKEEKQELIDDISNANSLNDIKLVLKNLIEILPEIDSKKGGYII